MGSEEKKSQRVHSGTGFYGSNIIIRECGNVRHLYRGVEHRKSLWILANNTLTSSSSVNDSADPNSSTSPTFSHPNYTTRISRFSTQATRTFLKSPHRILEQVPLSPSDSPSLLLPLLSLPSRQEPLLFVG